ncbi:MAG: bifunctional 23S rRNA (guanine(2069)-N(7))-methyltransferase RlmK/23S rRNA (guanine(2445)-N(2))-methyltransferase RlmL [Proteobacteria bacterium]|nr:bifunctional 23S rRNA (guanine(2069)-N(7))-methyltransferase RlmK/23S rRNA (guanine(2445)-N(2))-methyltransferase RlmL [Pseudomonadota bacterium]
MELVVTGPIKLEAVLAAELRAFGASSVRELEGAVAATGGLELAYRACLWSRVASRVLVPVARYRAENAEAIYQGARRVPWVEHLSVDATLALDVDGNTATNVDNTRFAMLRVKDAIVDELRQRTGRRPTIDARDAALRVHVYLRGDEVQLGIDLAGRGLHRRGYRESVAAPLKENVAAALLLLAEWPALAAEGGWLVDPMTGSATLPIEAALMACDVAPGLLSQPRGFLAWRGHDPALWQRLQREARGRDLRERLRGDGRGRRWRLTGLDRDPGALRAARRAVESAGLQQLVHLERRGVDELATWPAGEASGRATLLVCNPPYGERLGEAAALKGLYLAFSRLLHQRFSGATAWVLSSDAKLTRCLGLKATRSQPVSNGGIACRWLCYPIARSPAPAATLAPSALSAPAETPTPADAPAPRALGEAGGPTLLRLAHSAQAEAFANRLRKMARHWRRWAKRSGVQCYRVYDADIPEYAAVIDVYEQWVHLQEYAPPATVSPERAEERLHDMALLTAEVLQVGAQDLFVKVRERQRGGGQYTRLARSGAFHVVREGGHRFWVNLADRLDTGLFLDQRQVRALVAQESAGKRVLNAFCYTAATTVYAAKGGAVESVSVDLSATYLDWARRNFVLNGVDEGRHRLERADCREWLAHDRQRYDLIYLDPPTFSRSKRMSGDFDVQRDQLPLIAAARARLAPGDVLIFATNARRFRLEPEAVAGADCRELTAATLPPDFARSPRLRQVWRIGPAR